MALNDVDQDDDGSEDFDDNEWMEEYKEEFPDGYDEFLARLQQQQLMEQDDDYDSFSDSSFSSKTTKPSDSEPFQTKTDERYNQRPTQRSYNQRKSYKQKGYRRDPNDDYSKKVPTATIENLIKQRSQAQREGNYPQADNIRDELNNVYGVYVWDQDSLWTTSPIAPRRKYQRFVQQDNNKRPYRNNNNNRPEKRYFGRYGHDYTQIGHGIDPQNCPLNFRKIHALLAQRLEYKLVQEYDKADEIQFELYKNGVRVHDKLKQWRADGGVFDELEGMYQRQYNLHQQKMQQRNNSGEQLAAALQPETSNEQTTTVEDESLSDNEGVFHSYTQNKFSQKVEDNEIQLKIDELIQRREEMRNNRQYSDADKIRDELWSVLTVAVDDNSGTWSLGGDFGPNGTFRWTDEGPINPRNNEDSKYIKDWRKLGPYTQSPYSQSISIPEDVEEINNLLHDRLEAKRVNDYHVADYIRDHLYTEYGISVDDSRRQWSIGGFTGGDNNITPDEKINSSYVKVYNQRGGNGYLSAKDIQLVQRMIGRRAEEMARYNMKAVEQIAKGLRDKYSIIIDDWNCEWHVRGCNMYILSPTMEEVQLPNKVLESRRKIDTLLWERQQARKDRDFEKADAIRADLLDTYSVEIDDRLKEWRVVEKKRGKGSRSSRSKGEKGKLQDNEEGKSSEDTSPNRKGWGMEVTRNEDEVISNTRDMKSHNNQDTKGLQALTVHQLKERLKSSGLKVSGRKADLVERLLEYYDKK